MQRTELLPLFPLNTVLFPGACLPLRVFEVRYTDMVAHCLRDDSLFGVNLIAAGAEVGHAPRPHPVGVAARIVSCDAEKPGLLNVVAQGEQRYRITRTEPGPNGLLLGEIEWLPEPPDTLLPAEFERMAMLLQTIISDIGESYFPAPHRLNDAQWVSAQLAYVLPLPAIERQQLLEMDDALKRLHILRAYLKQQGMKQD